MFKRILVPVDGSAPSDSAIDLAARFAADQEARIAFVHAYDFAPIVSMSSGAGMAAIDPSLAVEATRIAGLMILQDAIKRFAASSAARTSLFLEQGPPVDSILNVARHWRSDLIVIGSHGRGGIARVLLGSVAEGVMRRAKVPVLVVHMGAERPKQRDGMVRAPAAVAT